MIYITDLNFTFKVHLQSEYKHKHYSRDKDRNEERATIIQEIIDWRFVKSYECRMVEFKNLILTNWQWVHLLSIIVFYQILLHRDAIITTIIINDIMIIIIFLKEY